MSWKTLGRRALFPHPAFIGLLCPAAAALLIYASLTLEPTDAVSLCAYVLSFYALVLVLLRMPQIVRSIQRFRQENKYLARYASDVHLRMNVSLHGALIFNGAYAVFQLCLGLYHRSVWFYAMAGYYFLLALMRLLLARYAEGHSPGEQQDTEWKIYRLCGVCLLAMTLALTIFILYFIWKIRVFRHHEITTIAMAAYTFASLALAVANLIRCRKYASPAYSAAKAISLVSALVSMLTLENAMLTAFGQESSEAFRRIMLGATGAAVVLAVQGIAISMIIQSGRKRRG